MSKEFALFLTVVSLGAGVASAQPVTVYGSTAPNTRVSFADLNLESESGIRKLQARVRHAARGLCIIESREALQLSMKRKACYDFAVGDGYAQISRVVSERMAGTASGGTIVLSAR